MTIYCYSPTLYCVSDDVLNASTETISKVFESGVSTQPGIDSAGI